ncbi:MAG TPA: universal stress protein [Chthonomonadaceae bacterium]|nr:universal stress protein [Chthonomonadaceae bacterium]
MIIETKEDVVRLSGSLHKNQWLTIRAAANLLLQEHPEGIIIDCGGLEEISEDGARTFLEAMRDIEAAKSRIIVANLPEKVLAVLRTVPGVRSQLPIADSVEEARASLRLTHRHPAAPPAVNGARRGNVLLVPLLAELDLTYGAHLAGRLAQGTRAEVHLVYLLEVERTLPLNAPLLDKEQAAQEALSQAIRHARQYSVPVQEHVERVRGVEDGILTAIRSNAADMVVLGATSEPIGEEGHEVFHRLVDSLLHRAPCEVIVGRMRPRE